MQIRFQNGWMQKCDSERHWNNALLGITVKLFGIDRNSMYQPARILISHNKSEILINSQFFRKTFLKEGEFAAQRSNCAIPDPAPMLPNTYILVYASPRACTSNETWIFSQYNKMHIETSSFIHIAYVILL